MDTTQRFYRSYVREARQVGDGTLCLQLCDGIGKCEAILTLEVARQLFPAASVEQLAARARMLHGFFKFNWSQAGKRRILVVDSFSTSHWPGDVEGRLADLVAQAGG